MQQKEENGQLNYNLKSDQLISLGACRPYIACRAYMSVLAHLYEEKKNMLSMCFKIL